jgi:hypothetical protein
MFIGIDYHKAYSVHCVLDAPGSSRETDSARSHLFLRRHQCHRNVFSSNRAKHDRFAGLGPTRLSAPLSLHCT